MTNESSFNNMRCKRKGEGVLVLILLKVMVA